MDTFKILDGRRSFYQWDLNQKLIIDIDGVDEVHFTLSGMDHALVCEVYQHVSTRLVNVPNILLQTDGILKVYAYVADGDGGYTTLSRNFTINPKPKPDDYVYTETELWTAEKAVQKALQEAKDSGDFTGPAGPKGDPGVVKFVVVAELPETDTENAIYLVPVAEGAEDNLFDEYIFVDGKWEKIGSAAVAVDMTGYVKDTDLVKPYEKAGLVNVNPSAYGIGAYANGYLFINPATNADIDAKTNIRLPIVPSHLDYAVKVGLTKNTIPLTDEEKAAACDWMGAVNSAGKDVAYNGIYGYSWSPTNPIILETSPIPALGKIASFGASLTAGKPVLKTEAPEEDNDCANKAYVDGLVGDIEIALDGIIAIQNELIGGVEA